MDLEDDPPVKKILSKNKNLEILEDYSVGVDLGEEYWRGWINNHYKPERGSFMVHTKGETDYQ